MTTRQKLIFIVGVGRSGTSLLQSMIGAHPAIAVSPETHFLRNYLLDAKGHAAVKGLDRPALIAKLNDDDEFRRADINAEDLLPVGKTPDLAAAFLCLAEKLMDQQKATYYCDKDPNLIDYLPALHRHFPEAMVVHIYRDPRDVVLSKTKAKWSKGRPYWLHAYIGEAQLYRGLQLGRSLFGAGFINVRYEDIIATPQHSLRELCRSLNVNFDERMLSFQDTAKSLVTEREQSWKKETYGPLRKNNSAKWKSAFTTAQIALIEGVSRTYFSELDYRKVTGGGSFRTRTVGLGRPFFNILYRQLRKNAED